MLEETVEEEKKLRLKTDAKLLKEIQIEEKKSIILVAIGFNYNLMNKKGDML